MAEKVRKESTDSHLRSTEAVSGYHMEATDGEIGHLDGFIIDDEAWTIRYIEVATRNWWPGKKVLVSPAWIEGVSWPDSKVKSASPGKPFGTARITSSPNRSLESLKAGSTFTTAGRHIGCTKPNPSPLSPGAALKSRRAHSREKQPLRKGNTTMNQTKSTTKDPICGMTVDEATALHAERDGKTFYFCSDHCRQKFLSTPAGTKPEKQVWRLLWLRSAHSLHWPWHWPSGLPSARNPKIPRRESL